MKITLKKFNQKSPDKKFIFVHPILQNLSKKLNPIHNLKNPPLKNTKKSFRP